MCGIELRLRVTLKIWFQILQVRRDEAHYSLNIMSTHICDWVIASNVVEAILRRTQCALH